MSPSNIAHDLAMTTNIVSDPAQDTGGVLQTLVAAAQSFAKDISWIMSLLTEISSIYPSIAGLYRTEFYAPQSYFHPWQLPSLHFVLPLKLQWLEG